MPQPTQTGQSPEALAAHRRRAPGQLAGGHQGGQGAADHLARGRHHHGVGHLLVERLPLARQALELPPVARKRPLVLVDPLPGDLDIEAKPHHEMAAERLANPVGEDAAAAESDRRAVRGVQQPHHRLYLPAAELVLPVGREELRDRHAQLLLEHLVGIKRLETVLGGDAGGRALAGSHEADEDERGLPRAAQRRHWMRSRYE